MSTKTVVVFWASTAAAVFLLGGTVASVEAVLRHPSLSIEVLLALSLVGLVVSLTVAGRIMLVVGRAQRSSRSDEV
jgi:hypothetical protein